MEKKVFLLDAYALIFRAYYAFIRNPRINSKGINTSAAFGFTNTLLDILQTENPGYIAVVFDFPGPNFRNDIFPAYKANRAPTPEDIKASVPQIKAILSAMHIPVIQEQGYEADDVIGTLAKKAEQKGFTVYMMTPDKDFAQLVSENIYMYKPKRSGNDAEVIGADRLHEFYGVQKPGQIIEMLGLMGDTVDNIPGAPGIGEKTAKKLIAEFGSIQGVYENIGKLKGKIKESIETNKEQVMLSRQLVTIETNVPVDFDESRFARQKADLETLGKLFHELEFRLFDRIVKLSPQLSPVSTGELATAKEQQAEKPVSAPGLFTPAPPAEKTKLSPQPGQQGAIQGSLFGDDGKPTEDANIHYNTIRNTDHIYHSVTTPAERTELCKQLAAQKEFCFDTETSGLDTISAELVGMSFSFKAHEAWYVPVPEKTDEAMSIMAEFRPVFENPDIRKTGQNLKFDITVLSRYGIQVKGELFDTMIAHYLIDPETRHNMDFLARKYLEYSPVPITALIGKKGASQGNMRDIPLETISEYACEDADITWQLMKKIEPELQNAGLTDLYHNVEKGLIRVLAAMELAGVRINTAELDKYAISLREEILGVEKEIFTMAGMEFNIASPRQLGEVLFDRMKIAADAKKTKTKQYSTSEDVLVKLQDKNPIIHQILEYRSLQKLLSTYVDALPKMVNPVTGKLHTSFNQARVATGRLSSDNPNLQNIPIREARGREIRRSFVPSDEEHLFLSADYSQVELRLMAHLSRDRQMIEAFAKGEDIHTATAAKIYKINIADVSREMRSSAKAANFGIIYGISAFGLSQNLNIPRAEAKKLIDSYFETYPRVKEYMEASIRVARDKGYVETLFDRRRILRDINSRNPMVRGIAERNAINAPIQGSAADIIKIAMIRIFRRLEQEKLSSKMILQVHDELDFDVYKPELEKVKEIVSHEMQNAVQLSVPLTVDIGVGNNWLEAH